MNLIKEFKEFAMRGNVVDMAVGVIIGAAFGNIVNSTVKDILMPPIGRVMGGADFKDLFINLSPAKLTKLGHQVKTLADATDAGAAVIAYGQFINTVINFVIVAACIFLVVKAMNVLMKRPGAPAPEPTNQEKLLTEIRDILKTRSS